MDPQTHPDPFADAVSHGIQRAVQVASSVATGAQVLVYLRRERTRATARHDEFTRRGYTAQLRAEQAAAWAGLAAIRDPKWLKNADLSRAAQAWGAAMPYADPATPWFHHYAATAMRHAEERLRVLHPTAMARYDRLRSDGADPAEAMRQAAPMFGYPPAAHDPPYTPARPLTAGSVTAPAREQPAAATAAASAQPGHVAAAAARPWEQDFPLRIGEVLAATAGTGSPPAGRPVPAPETSRTPRAWRQP